MNPQILHQIERLLSKSKEGKINWKQINQNSIRWLSTIDNQAYIVTLQTTIIGIIKDKAIDQYILTIQSNAGDLIMQLQSNTKTNPEYFPLLKELFDTALSKTKEESINILDKLLDNI